MTSRRVVVTVCFLCLNQCKDKWRGNPFGFGGSATGLPDTACRRADWGPSFVVFVAQLEPTAAEPEAAVAKSPSEPEAFVAKSTSEPEAAVAKSTSEPEAPAEAAPAEAAPAEAASAKAGQINVGPTSAVTPTVNGQISSASAGNSRSAQR